MKFFSKSRLPLQKWLLLMQKWSRELPVIEAADDVEVTEKSAIQLYQYFQDVLTSPSDILPLTFFASYIENQILSKLNTFLYNMHRKLLLLIIKRIFNELI